MEKTFKLLGLYGPHLAAVNLKSGSYRVEPRDRDQIPPTDGFAGFIGGRLVGYWLDEIAQSGRREVKLYFEGQVFSSRDTNKEVVVNIVDAPYEFEFMILDLDANKNLHKFRFISNSINFGLYDPTYDGLSQDHDEVILPFYFVYVKNRLEAGLKVSFDMLSAEMLDHIKLARK